MKAPRALIAPIALPLPIALLSACNLSAGPRAIVDATGSFNAQG